MREIYRHARPRLDELCAPYAAVVDIQPAHLPDAEVMDRWTSVQCVAALRHVPSDSRFNRDLRQFLHVAYKVAAELGDRYHAALETHANIVSRNVCTNLLDRHLRPLFGSLARRD